MNLLIYGAGGLGREVVGLVLSQPKANELYDDIFFVDDNPNINCVIEKKVFRFDELGKHDISPDNSVFLIAMGEPILREKIYEKVRKRDYSFETIVSNSSMVGERSSIKPGCIISNNGQISCDVEIGENTLIQGAAMIGHDCVIGANCVISSYSFLGGDTHVDQGCYIAPGAMIKQGITIGNNSIIGMGAVVTRNVPSHTVVYDKPPKMFKFDENVSVFDMFGK